MVVYDSIPSAYTNAANSKSYFLSRINYLDSILLIDSNRLIQLNTAFYNNCIIYKNRAYADNFNLAMNVVFNQITDSSYYVALYKNDIASTAYNAALSAISAYISRDKVSIDIAQQILPLLVQRERIVAIINKIYPKSTSEKETLLNDFVKPTQLQIDEHISKGGSLNNSSQIDIALYYATQLNLSQSQIAQLQSALEILNDKKAAFKQASEYGEYDSRPFESELLTSLLAPDEYTQVLTTKCMNQAESLAKLDWAQIVKYGLTADFVEDTTKTELTNFHLAILVAYYRNAYDKELQYKSVKSIQEVMPEALRVLVDKWEYKTPYSDTPDTYFQW